MQEYHQFVNKLEADLKVFISTPREQWLDLATKYVNGFAADELRRLVDIDVRRQSGAFFTDGELVRKILDFFNPSFNNSSYVYDPACGAGNLLISVSDYLNTRGITFDRQKQLLGTDQHESFVKAGRLRLETDLIVKGIDVSRNDAGPFFSIECKDGLKDNEFYKLATHIFVNPPFNQIDSKGELKWAKGKVSAAAIFIDKILEYTIPDTSIIAILPDVLRSGSRYEKWRKKVEQNARIENMLLLGQFDKFADVDVYAVVLRKIENNKQRGKRLNYLDKTSRSKNTTLKDLFDISVGVVVDNRDKKEGPKRPYIVSRGLEGWSIQREVPLSRKHSGKTVSGPFVVVKRTSRMTDTNRAIATIINIPQPVYVDNHLIVVKPKSGLVRDCKLVLDVFKDSRSNAWLNKQIRCRHLTVKVIGLLPVWNQE